MTRVGAGAACSTVAVALLAAAAPASAAPKRITGKLTKPGYTVIALAADGEATTDKAKRGRFALRSPAKVATLHLRAKDGTYAGPIVARTAKQGKRAIMGIKAGARLGRVEVRKRRGYAKVSRKLPDGQVDGKRRARAKKGAPIGAGNFGRVRSRRTHGGVPGDRDLDGIPDFLDVDDDGDRVLDDLDLSTTGRTAQIAQAEDAFHVWSELTLTLGQTVNHNAGSTDAEIDATLPSLGFLNIILADDSVELDCGGANQSPPRLEGLIYCSLGGTGWIVPPGPESQPPVPGQPQPFPGCCDPDGDGFGTLTAEGPPAPGTGGLGGMALYHGATSAQIATGDVLLQWAASGIPASQCPPPSASCASFPSMLRFVFATVPTLVSYSDTVGNCAKVSGTPGNCATEFSYAAADPDPGPFPVAADPSTGDVVVTLTFWRSQRRPIPGEPGYSDPPTGWTDIGGLAYASSVGADVCPQDAFSEADPPDANLVPATPDSAPKVFNNDRGGFMDQASDQPADPANTFTYRLNLTRCLEANGLSFESGEERWFDFQGITPNFGGAAGQNSIVFKRQ
jgi:hypothetical protein